MNRLCSVKINCPSGGEEPTLNLSSEAPDPIVFTGFTWTNPNPPRCLVDCGIQTTQDCFGTSYSFTSQDEADMLARLISIICNQDGVPVNGQQFTNDEQTASCSCGTVGPGGTFSTVYYTVPAGFVTSPIMNPSDGAAWIAASNASALAYAQQQVSLASQNGCLGNPRMHGSPGWICLGEELDPDLNTYWLSGANSNANYSWSVVAGSLPPGVLLVPAGFDTSVTPPRAIAQLIGTPTTAGVYTFTVQAVRTDLPNISTQVTDTLSVFGITNLSLPDATVGTAYSEQILTAGGTAPIVFTLVGTLPPGLSMNPATGIISGTPSAPGLDAFEVTVTDADGSFCTQTISITVQSAAVACPFPTMTWGPIIPLFGAPCSGSFIADTFSFSATSPATQVSHCHSTFSYNGPALMVDLDLSAAFTGNAHVVVGMIINGIGAPGGGSIGSIGDPAGTYVYSFLIPDTGGIPATIEIDVQWGAGVPSGTISGNGKLRCAVGYYLCGWSLIEQALHDTVPAACGPDNRTHWNGLFNLQTVYGGTKPMYYFTGQSLFGGFYAPPGVAISADQDALYPAGDWQNLGNFSQLFWDGATWKLWITDVCLNDIWIGAFVGVANPADASGTYARAIGSSIIPLYIHVSQVTDPANPTQHCITNCADFVPSEIDWLANPGTCRLKIDSYVDSYGVCFWYGTYVGEPIWDGTFPQFPGGNIGAYNAGGLFSATLAGFPQHIGTPFLNYDPNNNLWVLGIGSAIQGFLWAGTHAGPDPIGTYTQDLLITQCGTGPATFTVVGYTPP